MISKRRGSSGFTLIEIGVATFIVVLLLGSVLIPLGTQVEQRQVSDTQRMMEEIRDALVGYAAANGYLPCPDRTTGANSNDGVEDTSGGYCSPLVGALAHGNLPWSTLGLASTDAWGNRFRYVVVENFARRSPVATFGLSTTGTLRVCATQACVAILTDSAAAVVISHGRNGWGAINSTTNAANAAPAGADELENTDTDTDHVWHVQSALGSTAGEFDDLVIWLPRFTLFQRMLAAGRLP